LQLYHHRGEGHPNGKNAWTEIESESGSGSGNQSQSENGGEKSERSEKG
jgi:hypothetical protein